MINSQMDNPFMIGDLVHIPQGIMLYGTVSPISGPAKVTDKPFVGLVMKMYNAYFYKVGIGTEEYYIRKEDISLITRKEDNNVSKPDRSVR